jgi:HPt (histidine-containing phosphotransfer) domain-containing protein
MENDPQPALAEAITQLWIKHLPEIMERVGLLESAAESFARGTLTFEQREAANIAAHKLAGTLGMFNLTRGTVLARELEIMYSRETGPDPAFGERLNSISAELHEIIQTRK